MMMTVNQIAKVCMQNNTVFCADDNGNNDQHEDFNRILTEQLVGWNNHSNSNDNGGSGEFVTAH